MIAMRQLCVSGPFDAEPGAPGSWRLRQRGSSPATVYLCGFSPPSELGACTALELAWPAAAAGCVVTVRLPSGPLSVPVAAAFVHEPRPDLYRALPLERYEASQARFWRRIFRLVRLPGGRLLIALLANRSRRNAT